LAAYGQYTAEGEVTGVAVDLDGVLGDEIGGDLLTIHVGKDDDNLVRMGKVEEIGFNSCLALTKVAVHNGRGEAGDAGDVLDGTRETTTGVVEEPLVDFGTALGFPGLGLTWATGAIGVGTEVAVGRGGANAEMDGDPAN
jgi:hypothetical protein